MTPEAGGDFATLASAACPGFVAVGPPRRARKSELLDGELAGAPVIAKRLRKPSAVWAWYQQRELAMYDAFAAEPPPVRVPRCYGATADVLVIERFVGAPLATKRRPRAILPAQTITSLVASHDRLAAWRGTVPALPPTPAVRSQLRERLLEDPTAPVEWVRGGIVRGAARGLVASQVAEHVAELVANEPVAFSHGDLLLRNAIDTGDEIALVDWECAGLHLRDWDLALLWTQLAPEARGALAEHARRPAFAALVVFALVRELRFLRAFGVADGAREMQRTRTELADAIAMLT